jgi:mediator of RNA polymerase II transcription subunit 5
LVVFFLFFDRQVYLAIPLARPGTTVSAYPQDKLRILIRNALAPSHHGTVPTLSVAACLAFTSPVDFVYTLWSELSITASLGELGLCQQLGAFALSMPTMDHSPPLLPLFLHLLVPSVVTSNAQHTPPDQSVVELLVALISSSLTFSLHLEYALRGGAQSNSSTLSMARRLADDLKSLRHHHLMTSAISRRLAGNQTFITNFPMFGVES